jgi:hypothetical protein
MRKVLALVLFLGVIGVASADGLEKGDNEVSLRLSYSDTDFGSDSSGSDLGSTKNTDVSISYGWLVTDRHEVGLIAAYSKLKIDGGDIFLDESVDGTRFGAFYIYNFGASGSLTPYVGASLSTLGGDLGDSYNLQYGAEAGLKFYPFENGGISFGLGYSKLKADMPGLDDADDLNIGVGLLLKY